MPNFSERAPDEKEHPVDAKFDIAGLRALVGDAKLPEMEKPDAFFWDDQAREELFRNTERVAKYLHDNQTANLVLVDRSSRPLYVGLKEYWRQRFADDPVPNIYFVNPKGFLSREDDTPESQDRRERKYKWGDDVKEDNVEGLRAKAEIAKDFHATYQMLLEHKDEPTVIFDSCIHTGESLVPVMKQFEEAGFSDLKLGAITFTNENAKVQPDFVLADEIPVMACWVTGHDMGINKTYDSVVSRRNMDQLGRQQGQKLREEIRGIMREYLDKPLDDEEQAPARAV